MPKRIQINWRHKGGKKPPNTVVVARPSKWGNPFTVADAIDAGIFKRDCRQAREYVVRAFEDWLRGDRQNWMGPECDKRASAILESVHELRGKDLACYCPSGEPCHADVLLKLANGGEQNDL